MSIDHNIKKNAICQLDVQNKVAEIGKVKKKKKKAEWAWWLILLITS